MDVKNLPVKNTTPPIFDLEIHHTTAVPPFDQLSFLYRVSDTQFTTDYYHSFLATPTQQLSALLTNYLYATKHINQLPAIGAEYKLYPKLTKFYADYRNSNYPKATIAMHILLAKKSNKTQAVLLNKTFQVAIPIKEKTAAGLLAAWNEGATRLLHIESQAIIATLKQAH